MDHARGTMSLDNRLPAACRPVRLSAGVNPMPFAFRLAGGVLTTESGDDS